MSKNLKQKSPWEGFSKEGRVDEVLAALDAYLKSAREWVLQEKRKKVKRAFSVLFLGILIGYLTRPWIGGYLSNLRGIVFTIDFVFTPILFLGLLFASVEQLPWKRIGILLGFVDRMKEDISEGSWMSLMLDPQGYLKKGELIQKSHNTRIFAHSWLKLSGGLQDGNRFRLRVFEKIRRREIAKRSYTKVKERRKEGVVVALRINPKVYTKRDEIVYQMRENMRIAKDMEVKRFSYNNGVLRFVALLPPYKTVSDKFRKIEEWKTRLSSDKLIYLMTSVYTVLKELR